MTSPTDGQRAIDDAIQAYYGSGFDESARLTASAQSRLEFLRVQELVAERLAPASRVLDIGGATGAHAAPLAAAGHHVTLIDPVAAQVERAREHGTFEAAVGDARRLELPDDSFDAALLLGPLYHLRARQERIACLREAARVVVSGGPVLAAVILRFARFANLSLDQAPEHSPHLAALLEHGTPTPGAPFPAGHFHTADELEHELRDAGLREIDIVAIEGAAGLPLEFVADPEDALLDAALTIVRRTGRLRGSREGTNHLMGIGVVA